ncbi:MAG TPA: hypothetical protein VIL30_08740 [Ramlibacter sp.]|jgi:hypothetical protein
MTFRIHRLALAAAACLTLSAQAQTVTPPPLPPGHALVRLDPGMDDTEKKRHVRAHHHKFHHKKDFTRDDSIHGHESEAVAGGHSHGPQAAGAGAAATGGNAAAAGRTGGTVQDGRGTGPAREKTDRGASSWFYGQPDKK